MFQVCPTATAAGMMSDQCSSIKQKQAPAGSAVRQWRQAAWGDCSLTGAAARAETGPGRRLTKRRRDGGARRRLLAPRVRAAYRGVGGAGVGGAAEVHEVQAEDVLQQGVPGGGMEGRAQA